MNKDSIFSKEISHTMQKLATGVGTWRERLVEARQHIQLADGCEPSFFEPEFHEIADFVKAAGGTDPDSYSEGQFRRVAATIFKIDSHMNDFLQTKNRSLAATA